MLNLKYSVCLCEFHPKLTCCSNLVPRPTLFQLFSNTNINATYTTGFTADHKCVCIIQFAQHVSHHIPIRSHQNNATNLTKKDVTSLLWLLQLFHKPGRWERSYFSPELQHNNIQWCSADCGSAVITRQTKYVFILCSPISTTLSIRN